MLDCLRLPFFFFLIIWTDHIFVIESSILPNAYTVFGSDKWFMIEPEKSIYKELWEGGEKKGWEQKSILLVILEGERCHN